MSTKKKNRTIPASTKPVTKGRQTRTAKAKAVPDAASMPGEFNPAKTTEFTLAPELASTEAAVPAHVEVLPDHATRTRKLSALDAAFQVLSETAQAMSCPELIAAMAAKGYWSSPKGKTPASTLYAALQRELKSKGEQARFRKAEPGKFTLRTSR